MSEGAVVDLNNGVVHRPHSESSGDTETLDTRRTVEGRLSDANGWRGRSGDCRAARRRDRTPFDNTGEIVVMYPDVGMGEQQMRTGLQLMISTVSRGPGRAPEVRSWRGFPMSLLRLCDPSVPSFLERECPDNGRGGV